MALAELTPMVETLPQDEKVELLQFLMMSINRSENIKPLTYQHVYPIWMPYSIPVKESPNDEDIPTVEEVVAQIKATPPNPKTLVRPTKTVEQLMADLEAEPRPKSTITPSEWDSMWAEFEQELKENDRQDDIIEGRLVANGTLYP